mmetsp:Transcript_6088/g.9223  ORF Transcript_6088/g.9223 Transcript_6088/m.9223 type:complete len:104 (+) Transcript_6088:1092-1403(+)
MTNGPSSIVPKSSDIQAQTVDESGSAPNAPKQVNIRGQWTHNPLVLATLACSNMSSCEEVKTMYHECQKNNTDSMLCEAAEKYYRMCHLKGDEQSILDYNPIE